MSESELSPIPETPADPEPTQAQVLNQASAEDSAPSSPLVEPFAPPPLSDNQSDAGIEGDETGDALTGAAVSLAAARARLRQAAIGGSTSTEISTILQDLESLSTKLDRVIHGICEQPPVAPVPTERKFSGLSDVGEMEIQRLRSMRGELEIGQDYDESAAEQEISDLRRVRRQLRYLFALDSRKLQVEISDAVVADQVVSSRRLSSRQWAQSLVQNFQ